MLEEKILSAISRGRERKKQCYVTSFSISQIIGFVGCVKCSMIFLVFKKYISTRTNIKKSLSLSSQSSFTKSPL